MLGVGVKLEHPHGPLAPTDSVVQSIPAHYLDCPVPEHVHLGQEGIICHTGEEISLAHILWDDPLDELVKEHLERIPLRGGVHQVPPALSPRYNSPSVAVRDS